MALAPSSPRLPSPPPTAEIQMTPNSPSGGPPATLQATEMEQSVIDAHSKRRIHPGTKSSDMAAGPPLVPLSELESAFSLQEHLSALHYHHTSQRTRPVDRTIALQLAQPPTGIDRTLWLYELCRFLISQCNSLIVGFLFDTPPCSASTCPEMRASEWQFLCAVHEQPKSCCAIDYCCHTLDWAANVVSDQKIFPSRFVVLTDAHSKNVGVKNLVNVFRRLHRIFAHAWFQHRSIFWSVEAETGLYVFFKTVCDLYDLLPAENYKLPPEAEGLEVSTSEQEPEKPPPTILKPPSPQQQQPPSSQFQPTGTDEGHLSADRTNTRRHIRSSPSTGSAVTTVMETEEEEADNMTKSLGNMSISGGSERGKDIGTTESSANQTQPPAAPIASDHITLEDDKHDEPELLPSSNEAQAAKQPTIVTKAKETKEHKEGGNQEVKEVSKIEDSKVKKETATEMEIQVPKTKEPKETKDAKDATENESEKTKEKSVVEDASKHVPPPEKESKSANQADDSAALDKSSSAAKETTAKLPVVEPAQKKDITTEASIKTNDTPQGDGKA